MRSVIHDSSSRTRFAPDLLRGQVALITGGGTGMGRATAIEMACCGARIALLGRRIDPIESTAKVIRDAGGEAFAVSADIREPDLIERAMQRATDRPVTPIPTTTVSGMATRQQAV